MTVPSASMPHYKHVPIDPTGRTGQVYLEFTEEPVGLSQEYHGYPRIQVGEALGPNSRYEVLRKLGWGMNSSVWLARDRQSSATDMRNTYVSIKALKGYTTALEGSREREILQLSAEKMSRRCLKLLNHFTMPGKVSSDGNHLCLVTELMGGTVHDITATLPSGKQYLPLALAKRILRHALEGLAELHSFGCAHTDLKQDNIMLSASSDLDVEVLLAREPPRTSPPEHSSLVGTVQTYVSQPLPCLDSVEEYMSRDFFVSDFGSGQFVREPTTDEITPKSLRAPETVINGPWNEKVDIWTFGCLIFELIGGGRLFRYESIPDVGISDPVEGHLWQMICYMPKGDGFTPRQLRWSNKAEDYFLSYTSYLATDPPFIPRTFEESLRQSRDSGLAEPDLLETAAFIRRCLRIDPADRPSAAALLDDPFWGEESTPRSSADEEKDAWESLNFLYPDPTGQARDGS